MANRSTFELWTDGACACHRGAAGGWSFVLIAGDAVYERGGHEAPTTNNRMELRAVVEGLAFLPAGSRVRVYSDSQYVVEGASRWLANWKRYGWLTRAKQPIKNRNLWEQLDALAQRHRVESTWVQEHSGRVHNERCNVLASRASAGAVSGAVS